MDKFSIEFTVVDKDVPIYKTFTEEELGKMRITKGQLIELMGIEEWEGTYDTALPQQWLDDFVSRTGFDYHLVLSTTVWVYHPLARHGVPVCGCEEVNQWLPSTPFVSYQ